MHTPGQPDEQAWRRRQPGATTIPDEKAENLASPAAYSRLLTKKQLSDMAWGVRELSKRLGRVNLKLKVRTVFIVTKAHDEMLIHHTREVAKWLLSEEREVPYIVYVEERLRDNKKFDAESLFEELRLAAEKEGPKDGEANGNLGRHNRRLRFWTTDMCRARPHSFDFVITLGGDGTVLYASWLFQRIVPPVLSFSLGSLGFMTKFDFDHFPETLTTAFRDGVKVSLRLRFEATVMRSRRRKRATVKKDCFGMNNVLVVDDDEQEEEGEKRDLVEELIGEETDDERTHRPDGTYEILNDVIVDRGPSPSKLFILPLTSTRSKAC
jgi:NAD+ kinase